MRVFFTTTPRLKINHDQNIEEIFRALEDLGHEFTNDYLRKIDVEGFYQFDEKKVPVYYEEILDGLKKADVVIFESSLHSIGVGHLLQLALDRGQGVIALHMPGKFPFFLGGIKTEKLIIEEYTPENVKKVLKLAFEQIKDQMDERFTLLLPPKIVSYLNDLSKKKNIPKSVFIRGLIEREMGEKK